MAFPARLGDPCIQDLGFPHFEIGLPGHREDLCITHQSRESKDVFRPPDRSLPTD